MSDEVTLSIVSHFIFKITLTFSDLDVMAQNPNPTDPWPTVLSAKSYLQDFLHQQQEK